MYSYADMADTGGGWGKMKIFISWSDETGYAIASILGGWIPSVIQAVETYVSPEDSRKGTKWVNEVSQELNRSSLGIVCVVPGNIGAPWLNFEAGVLSESLDVARVIPLLVGVERSELDNGPLAQFPSAIYGKNDLYQILETINENTEKMRLSKERLRDSFELWWPKLDLDVESIMGKEIKETRHIDKPEIVPNTHKPGKTPERAIETEKKSETKETPVPDKPEKPVSAKPALEKIEIEMLKVLYDPPEYTPKTAHAVGSKLDISAQKVKEHLDKLERRNYVHEHLFVARPKEYSIAPAGREYLIKHDLLNKRKER